MIDTAALLPEIVAVSRRAGEAILAVYRTDFDVERKADESPVTQADLDAERIILDVLGRITPDIPTVAEEEVAAPEISNPAIRTIIASRAARLSALNGWKASGVIGENNQGLVEVRSLDAVPGLKERADVQRLIRDENADREQLYREIAAAKNVELSLLPKIRETYASTLRETAHPGDWIQQPDGAWVQKE